MIGVVAFVAGIGCVYVACKNISALLSYALFAVGILLVVYGCFQAGMRDNPRPPRLDNLAAVPIAGSPLNTTRIERAFRLFGGETPVAELP
jgi:hypothetical protein